MAYKASFESSWRSFILGWGVWPTDHRFTVDDLFFLFSPSFLCPCNFSKQSFNLFFVQISSMFILLLFVLFEIIYKIGIVFQFHHSLIFFIFHIWCLFVYCYFFNFLSLSWFILFFNLFSHYFISFSLIPYLVLILLMVIYLFIFNFGWLRILLCDFFGFAFYGVTRSHDSGHEFWKLARFDFDLFSSI